MSVEYFSKTEIDEYDTQVLTLSSRPEWLEHDLLRLSTYGRDYLELTNFLTIKILESLGCEVDYE